MNSLMFTSAKSVVCCWMYMHLACQSFILILLAHCRGGGTWSNLEKKVFWCSESGPEDSLKSFCRRHREGGQASLLSSKPCVPYWHPFSKLEFIIPIWCLMRMKHFEGMLVLAVDFINEVSFWDHLVSKAGVGVIFLGWKW